MKILIDENLPKRLKYDFEEYEIYNVLDKQWTSKKNGELLQLMRSNDIGYLITFDKNLQYQQNLKKHQIIVLILIADDNSYLSIQPLIPQIKLFLSKELKPGAYKIQQ